MFPNTFGSVEDARIAGCFKNRRTDTVNVVNTLHEHQKRQNFELPPYIVHRLQSGCTAWFNRSPHKQFHSYDPSFGAQWVPLEKFSPAMRETIEWLTLYLRLGWEIPEWGPVLGVWFSPREWDGILAFVGELIEAGNVLWAKFPHQVRRICAEPGPDPLPVLQPRLPVAQNLLRKNWDTMQMACTLTSDVRQYPFRGDRSLPPEPYHLVPRPFRDAIQRRVQARSSTCFLSC